MEIGKKRLGVTQTPRTDFENKFFVKIHNWRADFISPDFYFSRCSISTEFKKEKNSSEIEYLEKCNFSGEIELFARKRASFLFRRLTVVLNVTPAILFWRIRY